MKRESDIQNEIRMALSEHGIVFRTNSGEFWQGTRVYSAEYKQEVLINLRRVSGLPEGFSDLLFVGDAKIGFIEVKKPGAVVRAKQLKFLDRMEKLHHKAGIARSVADAVRIIEEDK